MLKRLFRKDSLTWFSRTILRTFQHLCLAIVVGAIFYVQHGSVIKGVDGTEYSLREGDAAPKYEDSDFFNTILINKLHGVAELVGISTMIETDGLYNSDKKIDVTAFVNRNSMLQSDYITGVYRVSDLIKWSQNGFEYEERSFSDSDSSKFLANTTIYTHLMKNNAEGGMNSFLNSQIDNNTVRTNINVPTEGSDAGTHTILLSRYKTINDENIEDIVSTWEGYNELCANITEAASTMALNYDTYFNIKGKLNFDKSNFRYYITRTINGKTETYTNIEELRKNPNGIDIGEKFRSYGKYIYFCPYDLQYSSNTKIDEAKLREILSNYDYAFPDQMKYYFAVDTEKYPSSDDFTIGRDAFRRYIPYYKQLYVMIIIFMFIYFVIIVHLIICEGHVEYQDGTYGGVERLDVFPIEITIILAALGTFFFFWGFHYVFEFSPIVAASTTYSAVLLGFFTFLADNAFSYGLYGLVRKIKTKTLYRTSLVKKGVDLFHKVSEKMSMRQNMFIITVVPYALSTFMNFYLIIYHDFAGIIIAIIMDIAIGIYVVNVNNDKIIVYEALKKIGNGEIDVKIDLNKVHGGNLFIAKELNNIVHSVEDAVNRSMRDEKLKADLITNVSHDIKTPLTSIINYVDLLKRENIEDERVRDYISILENKSQRLRQLTDDLVEASKISSGNITLHMERINFAEIIKQTLGEFYEKLEDSDLTAILKCEKYNVMIDADPRQLFRVIENLINNVCKYALTGTRVYLDLDVTEDEDGKNLATFSIKNISRNELNIKAEELTERFIRGDISRSTEGSGLGLSIAQSLTEAMGGKFSIVLDGDLFKANVMFYTDEFGNGNPSTEQIEVTKTE
ncbi:sensor histidine kinase [Butyrivibrio sp. MB2005]|uniref:sensor histidine kinase n=1 Tax=Butyrivibrio sp. MB2005 TaxID=1280678 RepID=UPI00040243BF|nr:HAMP domain-containing sensor histidine kinase [Butyrivibrio sp. MB2005]